jgi:hypothetical protein
MGEPWKPDPPPKRPRRPAVSWEVIGTLRRHVAYALETTPYGERSEPVRRMKRALEYCDGMLAWLDGRKGAK